MDNSILGGGFLGFQRTRPFEIFLAFFSFSAVFLFTQKLLANDDAYAALELAMLETEARAELLGEGRFTFSRSMDEGDGVQFDVFYSPQNDEENQWALVDPLPETAPKKIRKAFKKLAEEIDADRNIHLDDPRKYLQIELTLASETDELWIFHGGTIDVAGSDKAGRNFMRKAKGRLLSEVKVYKDVPRFHSLKMTNTKNIYPVPVAAIKNFYLKYEFGEAWPGGPIVQTNVEQLVEGRAFFVKFHMEMKVQNKNFNILAD